jgi:hypothetical protein
MAEVSSGLSLREFDRDGALEEATAAFLPESRRDFLRRGIFGGGAVAALLAVPEHAGAGLAKSQRDIAIVKFDVVLEYLQSALYVEAQRLGSLSPKTLEWARVVGAHELAHVAALKSMVDRPPPRPSFNFQGVTEDEEAFVRTAVAFEELTAAILKWQALRLHSREILAAAATLHSVETRHAAWIRRIVGVPPVQGAFDEPASQARMARLIDRTRFIVARPVTARRRGRPRYTG